MNVNNPYLEDTPEYFMYRELINRRNTLPNYLQSKEYRKHGFTPIEIWAEKYRDHPQLAKLIMKNTNVIPCQALVHYIYYRFERRKDKWKSAMKFINDNAKLIDEIRSTVCRLILGITRDDDNVVREQVKSKILSLNTIPRTRPMELDQLKEALYPFLVNKPTTMSWLEIERFHKDDVLQEDDIDLIDPEKESPTKAPWKTRNKVEAYAKKRGWTGELIDSNVNRDGADTWSMKQQRKYMTHFVGSRYAFVFDFMYAGRFAYCVAINVNTRKAFVAVPSRFYQKGHQAVALNSKFQCDAKTAKQCLIDILHQTPVKYILSDQEKAWTSHEYQNTMHSLGIEYDFVVKNAIDEDVDTNERSRLNHSSTSLVDRLIRTLRMMNYNMGLDSEIQPAVIKWLIDEYNSSPHSTLSKYIGRPVTPNEVDENPELERKVCSEIMRENFIARANPEYKPTPYVRVYNTAHSFDKVKPRFLPGHWKVVGTEDGLVKIKQGESEMKVSRWMLKSI